MVDRATEGLAVFLVGGAVRDQLLGYPYHERDWVVVGSTPEAMLARGFKSVGKDFPVFLHPETHEEYALARTERKSGHGYTGFTVHASPDVTLEEDLVRRDLTINAIAQRPDGTLVDPYAGAKDVVQRQLRHVSDAFQEDPLRVLRVARFMARYATLGFNVAPDTLTLMSDMVASGELRHLVAERVWKETERALGETSPEAYFELLHRTGALAVIMPSLKGEAYQHGLVRLSQGEDAQARWALLLSGLVLDDIETLCRSLTVSNPFRQLARALAQALACWQPGTRDAARWLEGFNALDLWRNPERFQAVLPLLTLCAPGVNVSLIHRAAQAAQNISAQSLIAAGYNGAELGHQIGKARHDAIVDVLACA